MARFITILATLALLTAALPAPALAQRPDRWTDTATYVECIDLASEAGSAILLAGVSAQYGTFAQAGFWSPGTTPYEDPPTWFGGTDQVVVASDGSLSATFDMFVYDETMSEPELAGTASFAMALEPSGEPVPFSYASSGTNRRFVVSGVSQALAVSGELLLPTDIAFALDGCSGALESVEVFITNPDAETMHGATTQLSCFWENESSFVTLFAWTDAYGTYTDLFVSDASGDYAGMGIGTQTGTAFEATYELWQMGGETEPTSPAGSATASAVLGTTGERINDRYGDQNTKYHAVGAYLSVSGTLELSLPSGDLTLSMDEASCSAVDLRFTQITTTANGPRGRPLANDLPENALPIAPGDAVRVDTAGTAESPEAPCLVTYDETGEVFELPFGHTAWWALEGTGGPVAIDTAGSSFDTALGVYVQTEAGFEQVACVDDVDSLQARLTLDTAAGTTYLVQAGGFAGQTGTLELAVE